MNVQPIEKRILSPMLEVHSIFDTIQGEGPFSGTPAVFVRLAGCNLRCPMCDTDYTSERTRMDARNIVASVLNHAQDGLVVVTGGEPFRQELRYLFDALLDAGFYVQVETNGTLSCGEYEYSKDIQKRHGVYIVCSPKTGDLNPDIKAAACAFKYVITANEYDKGDGLPTAVLGTRILVAGYGACENIYIQPEDTKDEEKNRQNMKACVAICKEFGYTLQLQIHKILEIE